MKNYLLFGILFLTGCTATMVSAPGKNTTSRYAPINETSRPGIIKYLNAGDSEVIQARREDAYKKMYKACNGKYKIINEGSQLKNGAIIPIGSGAYYSQSEYLYINFECAE